MIFIFSYLFQDKIIIFKCLHATKHTLKEIYCLFICSWPRTTNFFKLNICIFLEILDFSVFVFSKLGLFIKRLRESNKTSKFILCFFYFFKDNFSKVQIPLWFFSIFSSINWIKRVTTKSRTELDLNWNRTRTELIQN